ncbi:hypothetical protein WOLCODRAFT_140201 [Wolfiporia cocos MD-104 SS10]|uniref:Protein kinase domain-containing protein n=1 Tax=Wolfiporia cocos (strain MD-104) TaxID=742152 RepID=A0A2H3J1K4_WOLCO|nr:hypothetical protein WOLCODRAFT_140201 [Wolfiporia cocos MD-104 SS10]
MKPSKGGLLQEEYFWRDHYEWLAGRGYLLRSRYKPDWIPSWKDSSAPYWRCDDGHGAMVPHLLDATRIADGSMVVLKKILKSEHPYEIDINEFFSTEPLKSDPRNHCIPIYEAIDVPEQDDAVLLVMPLLRRFDSPPFETVGEAVEFFSQVFEGLQFMHDHHVAHRDCMSLNIMMDPGPLFPEMFHPRLIDWSRNLKRPAKHYARTERPVKYFFIDFGLSRKYKADALLPREPPIHGGDKSVPEFHGSNEPCDPFRTDIYYIGNMIREGFLQKLRGVEFIQPLIDDMVQDEPAKRPTIHEVVTRFEEMRASLSRWRLRSWLAYRDENASQRFIKAVGHFVHMIGYVVASHPAIPAP